MKNFRMNTEKTKKSKTIKAKEFLQTLDDQETSKRCCVIICIFAAVLLIILVIVLFVKGIQYDSD